jgi:hypothetical protein
LAQTDLYLPKIANKLYRLEPTSGNGKSQPIAEEKQENTANIAYTVFLNGSPGGTASFKFAEYVFVVFAGTVVMFGLWDFCDKCWELRRKKSARGITASDATV